MVAPPELAKKAEELPISLLSCPATPKNPAPLIILLLSNVM
jgi:hypothetical protein